MAATIYKAHTTRREPPLLKMRRLGEKYRKAGIICSGILLFTSFSLFHSAPLGHDLVLFIALVNVSSNLQYSGSQLWCWMPEDEMAVLLPVRELVLSAMLQLRA